ncbi:MAG: hypothetical protein IJ282_11205 [Lachnospiraceae bacterium]|nr:hypothetical protein [Lachnospiraceae bacterium]
MRNRKEKILLVLVTATISFALTGCGHEHEWERATCTEPRTCISCGETDGEPKGHDWIEATDTPVVEQSLYERVGGKLYVGDEFTLGTYEQDNNLENGAEDIEWIVLEKDSDGTYLCISKYILDARPFNTNQVEIVNNWGTSSLREWLNSTFFDTAFSEKDAENLVEMKTSYISFNPKRPNVEYRDAARDMVRLIKETEIEGHPGCVKVTEYAAEQKKAGCIDDGTREHENCSNAWWTMTCSVSYMNYFFDEYEDKYEEDRNYIPTSSVAELCNGIAMYAHTERTPIENINYYGVTYPNYPTDRESVGVRPVISVKLIEE